MLQIESLADGKISAENFSIIANLTEKNEMLFTPQLSIRWSELFAVQRIDQLGLQPIADVSEESVQFRDYAGGSAALDGLSNRWVRSVTLMETFNPRLSLRHLWRASPNWKTTAMWRPSTRLHAASKRDQLHPQSDGTRDASVGKQLSS